MHSPKEILVTTTSTLEGWQVVKYLKPISSHLVAGTNYFNDLFASFSDLFGGRSEAYQRQISSLYSDAIEQLKFKAYEIGSNCIIGLSVDLDEISGKGKSMFMITATGTAVIAKSNIQEKAITEPEEKIENASADRIRNLQKRKTLIFNAQADQFRLGDETWSYITDNKVFEVFDQVIKKWKYVKSLSDQEQSDKFFDKLIEYVGALPENIKFNLVYSALIKEEDSLISGISKIIRDLQLLNLDIIKTQLGSNDFQIKKGY